MASIPRAELIDPLSVGPNGPPWRPILSRLSMLICLALASSLCHGSEAREEADPASDLPSLPGEASQTPETIAIDSESISLSDAKPYSVWNARLEGYRDMASSFTLDRGMLLTDKLAAGATFSYRSGLSDVLVNAIYAPSRNWRIQFAAGKMRAGDVSISSPIDEPQTRGQTSFLASIRKQGKKTGVFSGAGFAVYAVTADGVVARDTSTMESAEEGGADEAEAIEPVSGMVDGYMLDLELRPTRYSSIELMHKRETLSYRLSETSLFAESRPISSIGYSRFFSDCSKFHGRFSTDGGLNELDLGFTKGHWAFSILHTRTDDASDTSAQVTYSMPLGTLEGGAADCDSGSFSPPSFDPIMDAAIERPNQLPDQPLPLLGTSEE